MSFFARNLTDYLINCELLDQLTSTSPTTALNKINKYIKTQPPCLHKFFTAHSTASGRCEKGNSILRELGFTNPSNFIKTLHTFQMKVEQQYDQYIRDTLLPQSTCSIDATLLEKDVSGLYSECVLKKLEKEYTFAVKGYTVDCVGENTYRVSYNADGKPHLPYNVKWFVEKNNQNEAVCTCDCSFHASAGYPCRHIISTALFKKAKITKSFFQR